MNALGDIRALLLDVNQDLAVVSISHNLLVVHFGFGCNLSEDHDHVRLGASLAGNFAVGVLFEAGVERCIRNLITEFIGVSLVHGLRSKQEGVFHSYKLQQKTESELISTSPYNSAVAELYQPENVPLTTHLIEMIENLNSDLENGRQLPNHVRLKDGFIHEENLFLPILQRRKGLVVFINNNCSCLFIELRVYNQNRSYYKSPYKNHFYKKLIKTKLV
ncbi:S-adenosylmethionine synthase 2-like [Pyrus ussuriensis x Pyrus communis]|uniref:S-adenosylmethionine synthase 2-like n=1 Tax=Pyrus ussuriensis x Pyrus communis TaxID=2448454 RepID=A0A5N5HTY8_9ROSA|nr:S-adenosylmethionine synthase 2-like [Pyrus ussuriensis x Pyrus communis]